MDKSDKQIAAEFDAYCAEAERAERRRFEHLIMNAQVGIPSCCDTGERSWGRAHDSWCQLANETEQTTAGRERTYVCPDCGVRTVDASHAIVCSMPGNRYRNMANQ